ncbi:hypothetical protein ACOMHN_056130 [Nucella lapillus]
MMGTLLASLRASGYHNDGDTPSLSQSSGYHNDVGHSQTTQAVCQTTPHQNYTRTAVSFTIIALVLAVIGHCFAFYTLRRPRYIIKRLTALLHFMTAACILVLNEVLSKTAQHERDSLPAHLPVQAAASYGFSFVLSWIVFVLFVLAGIVFLFLSHKRKAEYADQSEDGLEDEPMHLGRT